MLQAIVSGSSWFFVFLAVHILWFHRVHVKQCFGLITKMFAGCVIGHTATIVVQNWDTSSTMGIITKEFYGVLTMACLFILYMPFYYTIVSSLSVQTLIFLEESSQHALSMRSLRERFASKSLVHERLKILTSNGYLTEGCDGYTVTRKGHLVSIFFIFFKKLWRLSPGG
jgi:hypothetical protein